MSLRLLLEGESLLNDASSITLFTIFLSEVMEYRKGVQANAGVVVGNIIKNMVVLAVGAPSDGSLSFCYGHESHVFCIMPCRASPHASHTHASLQCAAVEAVIQHKLLHTGSNYTHRTLTSLDHLYPDSLFSTSCSNGVPSVGTADAEGAAIVAGFGIALRRPLH